METNENEKEVEKKPIEIVNQKEKLYDKIPITVKTLDIIIRLLIFLLFVAMLVGLLKGNGVM